jgi:hypothetical protein
VDYIQLFNDLNALKEEAKTKDEEVSDKHLIRKKGNHSSLKVRDAGVVINIIQIIHRLKNLCVKIHIQ